MKPIANPLIVGSNPTSAFEETPINTGDSAETTSSEKSTEIPDTNQTDGGLGCGKVGVGNRRIFTYIIQGESGGPLKIGRAFDVGKRLAFLQVGYPHKLRAVFVVLGDIEGELHSLCSGKYQMQGEWFKNDPPLLEILIGRLGPEFEKALCDTDKDALKSNRRREYEEQKAKSEWLAYTPPPQRIPDYFHSPADPRAGDRFEMSHHCLHFKGKVIRIEPVQSGAGKLGHAVIWQDEKDGKMYRTLWSIFSRDARRVEDEPPSVPAAPRGMGGGGQC